MVAGNPRIASVGWRARAAACRRLGRSAGLAATLLAAAALPLTPATAACITRDHDALLVLDASSSMLRPAGMGLTRFALAKQAVLGTLALMPDSARVALRLYGSGAQAVRGDCRDTLLLVPFAPVQRNRNVIEHALADAHARGVTPIAYSLQQVADDFPDDGIDKTVVLVSDGGEDCGGDPCSVAGLLAQRGIVINTVGLQADARGTRQLQCMAQIGHGQYFAVPSAAQLQDKLMQAMGVCPVSMLPVPGPGRRLPGETTDLG